jgi:uncharacterized protein (DUF885 family)
VSWDIWTYALERAERSEAFRHHDYMFGRGGPHAGLPNFLINFHRVDQPADMDAYIARLTQMDDVMRQYLQRSLRAVESGIRQPRFGYDYAIAEIDRVMRGAPFTDDGVSPLMGDIETKVTALLENGASEQGARMSAMDNATRNAGDMINKLTIQYNRSRQAAITKELIEIISGAEAL